MVLLCEKYNFRTIKHNGYNNGGSIYITNTTNFITSSNAKKRGQKKGSKKKNT